MPVFKPEVRVNPELRFFLYLMSRSNQYTILYAPQHKNLIKSPMLMIIG